MIVQWCMKGMSLPDTLTAAGILTGGDGLLCNAWRNGAPLTPGQVQQALTPANADLHVNHFDRPDPGTRVPFSATTPFVSLSAGTVERHTWSKTNELHSALKTALWFGSDFGRLDVAYVFVCWVVLAPRAAVEVEGVAEEVRDLNTYRRYSAYQTEGEILAKVRVPGTQVHAAERWEVPAGSASFRRTWREVNRDFVWPEVLTNIRGML